ncbi:hypothetical protein LZ554_002952 [Drepanopeziza brunnea f. sp. 'monogermtubi']|nr:hypothetical protein LZ554_002952 [Drepanopeziza brunnea f. sp. 'monogermtubi']
MAGRKRKATSTLPPQPAPSRRQSGRAKKAQVVYAESDAEDASSSDDFHAAKSESEADISDAEIDEPEDEEDGGGGGESEVDVANKATAKGWRKTVLADGRTRMEIDLPSAKDAGDTPYEDGRLHPNTLDFLGELKRNNRREWLKFNDVVFRQAEKDFQSFVTELSSVVCEIDPTIPELPVKDIIYRIHRDMRFTTDPTPYKSYFSVAWSRAGRKGPYAHYYLHVQPGGESFMGGGYFGCDAETLACLREDIDTQPHQLKSILMEEKLRTTFFPKVKAEEGKIVKAFCEGSKRDALKKKPKGFDADHKDIELLKLRNFVLTKKLSDADIVGKDSLKVIGDIMEAIEPFITYLNHTVMPDRS